VAEDGYDSCETHMISTAKHHDECSNLMCERKLQPLNAIKKAITAVEVDNKNHI